MKTAMLVTLGALFLSGCIHADPATDISLRASGGQFYSLHVTDAGITGPRLAIGRYEEGDQHVVRGRAFGKLLDVTVAGTEAVGTFGGRLLHLSARREDRALHVSGASGGRHADFVVSTTALRGRIGACGYDLTWTGEGYEGTRGCGSGVERVSLEMPPALASWRDAEVGASLAAVLGTSRRML